MKKIRLFVFIMSACMLTMKCSENELSPDPVGSAEKVYPSDIMVFKTQAEFRSTLEKLKNYDTRQLLAFSKSKGVKTLYALWKEAEEKQKQVLSENQELMNEVKLALDNNDEEKAKILSAGLAEKVAGIQHAYQDIVEVRSNFIRGLKYKDGLMANVLNRAGMIIVEDMLLQYSNNGISSIPYENPGSLEEIKKNGKHTSLNVLPAFKERDNSSLRDDQMFYGHCSGAIITGNPHSYYDATFRIVNTYVPVYRTEQVWVPEECIEKPSGGIQCFPGYWTTVNLVDHYDLTNTRVSSYLESRSEYCFIYCWDTGGYTCFRRITLTGYLNVTVEETGYETSRYWDIGPYEHGSINATYAISPRNIYREICIWSAVW